MTRSVGPCKRCGGPVLHSHQYVNLRGGIRHITCTPRNRARVVIAAGALGLAVVGTACVPPPPPATLIPPALLRACNGPVVTFMEGYPVPCDVVPPQVLNIRLLPGLGDNVGPSAGMMPAARCDWMGGHMATSGAVLLCEQVDY